MTGTLIFILFLLNILFAFALLLLFMRQNRLMDIEKRQKLMLEESEQVMAALLEEMKEENERLLDLVTENKALEDRPLANMIIEEMNPQPDAAVQQNDSEEKKPLEPSDHDVPEASQESDEVSGSMTLREQVEILAAQGLTITEIARKLNKGKTEIELLMKFQ